MNAGLTRALSTGAFFVVILGTGFWLSRSGKPYNGFLFTIHKLIALGALVFIGVTAARIYRVQGLQPGQIAAVAAAGVCFVASIVTGGLVSANANAPAVAVLIHRLFPYLTVIASAAALYLMR